MHVRRFGVCVSSLLWCDLLLLKCVTVGVCGPRLLVAFEWFGLVGATARAQGNNPTHTTRREERRGERGVNSSLTHALSCVLLVCVCVCESVCECVADRACRPSSHSVPGPHAGQGRAGQYRLGPDQHQPAPTRNNNKGKGEERRGERTKGSTHTLSTQTPATHKHTHSTLDLPDNNQHRKQETW